MHEAAESPAPRTDAEPRVAVSIKQPWATLIAHGLKTIELRRWQPRRRGEIYIHASANPDESPEAWAKLPESLKAFAYRRRGVVGKFELKSVKRYATLADYQADQRQHLASDEWFSEGLFGWLLQNPQPLPFEPRPGNLRLFRL